MNYKIISQIGKGKDGKIFLVRDYKNREYAMKTFRKNKSLENLRREYDFLKKASKENISPKVYELNEKERYIVMEKMDSRLLGHILEKGLSKTYQLQLFNIFSILDDLKIYHNDANLNNYMLKDGKIYILDFGLAKPITAKLCEKLGTNFPNAKIMTAGFILKLRKLKISEKSFSHLFEKMTSIKK